MSLSNEALEALKEADFDWAVHLRKVWDLPKFDVPDFQIKTRERLFDRLDKLFKSSVVDSPLGIPLVGAGGAGKTHLLSVLRQRAFEQGAGFVLVDMTDVRDFWETLVQHYLSSLFQVELDGRSQLQKIIDQIFTRALPKPQTAEEIAEIPQDYLSHLINRALEWLRTQDQVHTLKYRDCVRAVILANSKDWFVSAIGMNWLQGLELEPEERKEFGFASAITHSQVAAGLSWLMSLRGPSVIAIDQLDPIVAQHYMALTAKSTPQEVLAEEEKRASKDIIQKIGEGLIGLRDHSFRSLIIVSCLEMSWEILTKTTLSTFIGRFETAKSLPALPSGEIAAKMITLRLSDAYHKTGFVPPYPSYPFKPEFFQQIQGLSPRSVLQRCHEHREHCLKEGKVIELGSETLLSPPPKISDLREISQ